MNRRVFLSSLVAIPFFGLKKPPVVASFSFDETEIDQIVKEAVTMAKFYERGIAEGWCTPDEAIKELTKQILIAKTRLQNCRILKQIRCRGRAD